MATLTKAMQPTRKHGPPTVIHAGLMRTGTLSMARAYDMLDLRAHHGLDLVDLPIDQRARQWALLERAVEATWPEAQGVQHPLPRFTREDWDELFGEYDVVTDLASSFADQLIESYPEAKVVIVQRDFDAWWDSFDKQCLQPSFSSVGFLYKWLSGLTGLRAMQTTQKLVLGFFHAKDTAQVKENARQTWEAYYARVRELVPPERRLEYKLSDGWGPLCEFLGKEVPDVPFPRVNDRVEHSQRQMNDFKSVIREAGKTLKPW